MTDDNTDLTGPPAPIPEKGKPGEPAHGAEGGDGGQGGRGGIGLTGPQGVPGKSVNTQSKFDKFALAIVVAICAISAVVAWQQAGTRLSDAEMLIEDGAQQRELIADQSACQQKIIEETIVALKARSTFAEQSAKTGLVLEQAQKAYLETVIDPTLTQQEQLHELSEYLQALDFSIQATREQLRLRDRHPFADQATLESCRR
jgi:hypothetical protein